MGKLIYEGLQTSLEGVPQTTVFLTGRNLASWWDRHSPRPQEAKDGSEAARDKLQEDQSEE